jgi:hypothetical protein
MIGKILASGQLGKLASFVTPAFFDVMPAKALWSRARKLLAGTRDHEAFRHAVAERSASLARVLPEVQLVDGKARNQAVAPAGDNEARASRVVELFFHQLFYGRITLLDLRAQSFSPDGDRLRWHPASWVAEFTADFIGPLRDIYRGFYTRDDAKFREGLQALSLQSCEDLFRKHFGGDQEKVTFRTVDFVETFHQVFQRCKQQGTALHPDFLPLGIYLAALYDHLEDLAVAVDVSAAFDRATRATLPDPEALHA